MFKINAEPTFDATLTIVGQGREQQLKVTFRSKTRSDYVAMLENISKNEIDVVDALLSIIEKWDADAELSTASIKQLQEQQPGCDWAILTGYGNALGVARKGN